MGMSIAYFPFMQRSMYMVYFHSSHLNAVRLRWKESNLCQWWNEVLGVALPHLEEQRCHCQLWSGLRRGAVNAVATSGEIDP